MRKAIRKCEWVDGEEVKKLTNRNGSRFVVEYVRNDGRLVENARENFLNVGGRGTRRTR